MWNTGVWTSYTHAKFGSLQSTSSSGSMSSDSLDQVELPVWIGGCEKWVTGLNKRITCDDVIYALLSHDGNPNEDIDITCYAIYERWREMERPLRGRTKILKVWRAWGTERHKVKFSVGKVGESQLDTRCEVSRSKKGQRRSIRDKERKSKDSKGRSSTKNAKNETDAQKSASTEDKYKAKAFHQMVQTVIEQEKKIQDQLTRLKETDVQIESYETKMHLLRIKENGQNYVQEAYLRDKSDESSSGGEELFPAIKANDLDTYSHICDNILQLEDRIVFENNQIHEISIKIQGESCMEAPSFIGAQSSTPRKNESVYNLSTTFTEGNMTSEDILINEMHSLTEEMERCISLNNAQHKQMQLVNETLDQCEWQLQKKQTFVHSLLSELSVVEEQGHYEEEIVEEVEIEEDEDDEVWDDNPTVDLIEHPVMVSQSRTMPSSQETQGLKARPKSMSSILDTNQSMSFQNPQNSLKPHPHHVSTSQLPPHLSPANQWQPSQHAIRRDVPYHSESSVDYQQPVTIKTSTTSLEPPPLHSILRNKDGSRSNSVSSRDSGHGSPDSLKDSGVYVHFNLDPLAKDGVPPRPPPRKCDPRRMSMPDMTQLTERLAELPTYARYEDTRITKDMEFYVTKSYLYHRDVHPQKQPTSDNESNSDTGLSSLHSDETPPILETLV